MLKIICVSAAAGVIALIAGVPGTGVRSFVLAEPHMLLLAATAFFGLAFATRWRWKGPR